MRRSVSPFRCARGTIQLSTPLDNVNKANPFGSNQYESGLRFSVSQPLLRNAGTAVNEASIEIAKFDQQAVEARARLQSIPRIEQ